MARPAAHAAMRTRIKRFDGAGRRGMAKACGFAAKVRPVAPEIGGIYRRIAEVLNERGIVTAQGKRRHGACACHRIVT